MADEEKTPQDAQPPADSPVVTVVNLFATAYSGSTLLSLLLGAHSKIFAIGELRTVYDSGQALCTLHGYDCPLWSKFQLDSEENPFLQIARLTGRKILVVHGSKRLLDYQDEGDIQPKLIHMIRDGRVVTAQYLREHPSRSMWLAARTWVKTVRRNERLLMQYPEQDGFESIYENLQKDMESELREVCGFLGVEFEPAMLERINRPEHFLGGKVEMVRALTARRLGMRARLAAAEHHDPTVPDDHGMGSEEATAVLNLTGWQKFLFNTLAGRLNRGYGYE